MAGFCACVSVTLSYKSNNFDPNHSFITRFARQVTTVIMKNSLLILGLVLSVLAVASAYPPYANEQYDYVEEQENDLAEEQQGNEMDEMTRYHSKLVFITSAI